jgi:flavin-dependent dehydrogenase
MVSDVLILGGGLAGASAALELARAGVGVRLLERDAEAQHKVCGEFLSIEAQQDLARLGMDVARLGAVPIDRVRIVRRAASVEAPLGFTAMGVSRKALDAALLDAAEARGAQVNRGVKVTGIGDGEVGTSHGPVRARTILLATGKHDVRGLKRPAVEEGAGHVGFKTHWRLSARASAEVGHAVELVLFDGGYVGMQRIAHDVLNLCLIVRGRTLAEYGGNWDGLLARLMREPHIARRIGGAVPLFDRPLAIANLPYGFVHAPSAVTPPGIYRLGDQAAVTAPLTGDGMAIAMRSAALAAQCVQAGLPPAEYHRRVKQMVAPQVRRAMLLHKTVGIPALLPMAMRVLGVWPGFLRHAARLTRIPHGSPI